MSFGKTEFSCYSDGFKAESNVVMDIVAPIGSLSNRPMLCGTLEQVSVYVDSTSLSFSFDFVIDLKKSGTLKIIYYENSVQMLGFLYDKSKMGSIMASDYLWNISQSGTDAMTPDTAARSPRFKGVFEFVHFFSNALQVGNLLQYYGYDDLQKSYNLYTPSTANGNPRAIEPSEEIQKIKGKSRKIKE